MKIVTEIRGRKITNANIEEVRSLIDEHESRSRSFISRRLAERWKWRQANGGLKDRACRDILLELEKKNFIELPPVKRKIACREKKHERSKPEIEIDTTPMTGAAARIKPLLFKRASRTHLEPMWNFLVSRYHYLGYKILVGKEVANC